MYFCRVTKSCPTDSLLPPWTAVHQASLTFTISQSLFKLMSVESVMPPNHLILCLPLHLLPSILPSIRVFSSESAFAIGGRSIGTYAMQYTPPQNETILHRKQPRHAVNTHFMLLREVLTSMSFPNYIWFPQLVLNFTVFGLKQSFFLPPRKRSILS